MAGIYPFEARTGSRHGYSLGSGRNEEQHAAEPGLDYEYAQAEYDESMEDLLYRRNASWIAAIEKMHATGNAFIAVGALHLMGPRSVLELLAQKGFRIARVMK